MTKIFHLTVLVAILSIYRISAQPTGSLQQDGNKYPTKILLDSNLWMTTNLATNIPNSYCYDNLKQNCDLYGRLYTWESAKQGCELLGDGWRLPGSDEWQQLTQLYGTAGIDSTTVRKEAYKTLMYTGASGFKALLGGGRDLDGQYARLNAHGFFWTATEIDSNNAWYYNFAKGSQALYQQDGGEKIGAFSVRCIKSLGSTK